MPINNPRHSRFFWRSSAMFGILDQKRQFKEVNSAWENTLGLSTSHSQPGLVNSKTATTCMQYRYDRMRIPSLLI